MRDGKSEKAITKKRPRKEKGNRQNYIKRRSKNFCKTFSHCWDWYKSDMLLVMNIIILWMLERTLDILKIDCQSK